MTSPIFTRVPSCPSSLPSRPVALVDTDALRHAEPRPVALSRVTVAVGYAVVTVAISTEAGALAERIAIATTMTTSTAAPIVHLLIQRCRRRGANDFDSRSMESFERSGVDTLRPCDKSGTNYSGCSHFPLEEGNQYTARKAFKESAAREQNGRCACACGPHDSPRHDGGCGTCAQPLPPTSRSAPRPTVLPTIPVLSSLPLPPPTAHPFP